MKTQLNNRVLWFDGTTEVEPKNLINILMNGCDHSKLAVTEINDDVLEFNKSMIHKLTTKTENHYNVDWILPEKYMDMSVEQYVEQELLPRVEQDSFYDIRLSRLINELLEFEKRDLYKVIRVLKYVIDTMKDGNHVWGVGRGSSCASYLLYLMGLHSVDSVKYDIPITEFLR